MATNTISIRVLAADGAQTDVIIVPGDSLTRIKVTRITVVADGDNSVKANARVGFAISALPSPNLSAGAGIIADFMGIPGGGGVTVGDGSGPLGIGKAGESLRYACESPTGGGLTIGATYENVPT